MSSPVDSTSDPTNGSSKQPSDAANNQLLDAPVQLSPTSTTSSISLTSAPTLSPHSPATTAIEPTQVEGSLINPAESSSSNRRARSPRRSRPPPPPSHSWASNAEEPDYFTPVPRLHSNSSEAAPNPTTQIFPPVRAVSSSDKFVEAAREELYGNARTIDLTNKTEPSRRSVSSKDNVEEPHGLFKTVSQRTAPVRSKTEHPSFPNQSLSALHTQFIHPRASPTHYTHNRWASSQSSLFAPGAVTPSHRQSDQLHDQPFKTRTSRTAGNTPHHTPGLYPFQASQHYLPLHPFSLETTLDELNEGSLQTSPYLHPAQQQPPRTVTSADRQVDTFSGRKIINHYEIHSELGRGVHGKVKLARDLENGKDVAIKIVSRYSKRTRLGKTSKPEDKVRKEVAILKKIQHPNVVRLIEVIDDPDIAKVYLVLEFCELKEINWRHSGYAEIILAEHYRQLAEYQGQPKEAQDTTWRKIDAERRRKRKREARRVPSRRETTSSTEEQESHMWSLEYGGETDEESYSASEQGNQDLLLDTITGDKVDRIVSSPESANLELRRHTTTGSSGQNVPQSSSSVALDSHVADLGNHLQRRALASANVLRRERSETSMDSIDPGYTDGFSFYSTEWYQNEGQGTAGPTLNQILERSRGSASSISAFTDNYENEIPEDFRYVPTMSIPECRTTFRDALVGIEYLHHHGIVHRDIKPENLLRNRDRRVKISDFGVSYLGRPPVPKGEDSGDASDIEPDDFDEETALAKTVGTPAFYAPELCNLDVESDFPVVTGQIDVWALGVTLFCLLFGRTPFTAENQFILMRKIAADDVFIPRLRLKAVNPLLRSPGPEGALYAPDKRLPDQWLHEPIDDELYDLLEKLFMKDPRDRIHIQELKHHPWVLRGLVNPSEWLEETNPVNYDSGKTIEPSNEEVAEAVIPIKIVERIRSLTKRASSALGLSGRRRRGQSSATSSEASTTAPSQDGSNKDLRRQSLQPGDSAFSAFKSPRDKESHEHPLAISVTASPTSETKTSFLDEPTSLSSSAISPTDTSTENSSIPGPRPGMPDRQISELSTAASIRTIRQSDIDRGLMSSTSPPPQKDSETSAGLLEAATSSSLKEMFNSASRSLLRTLSRDGNEGGLSLSSEKSLSPDPSKRKNSGVGEPSVAVSNAAAAGELDVHGHGRGKARRDNSRSSSNVSRNQSARELTNIPEHLTSTSPTSTTQSTPATGEHSSRHHMSPAHLGGGISRGSKVYTANDEEPTEEEYHRAMDGLNRRRNLEDLQNQELLNASRPLSSHIQEPCPPSPDDESPRGPRQAEHQPQHYFVSNFSPSSTAFSSEDHLVSDQSRSTSYPSVPSVLSADSSENPESVYKTGGSSSSSEDTAHAYADTPTYARSQVYARGPDSDDDFVGDGDGNGEELYTVAETDEDDESSSDSDDDFLLLSRRKSKASRQSSLKRGQNGDSAAQDPVKKTERSGSTNTMRKVVPQEAKLDEEHSEQ